MMDIRSLSVGQLLSFHSDISAELKQRGITRSANNPTGDLAEYIFCKAFHWEQAANSVKGYDAIGKGVKYQIKGRRLHKNNKSRQLSALRDLETRPFDMLAGLLFNPDYTIYRAAIIPYDYVLKHTRQSNHTNSHLFHLRDSVWDNESVQDVTYILKAVKL